MRQSWFGIILFMATSQSVVQLNVHDLTEVAF